MQLWDTIGGNDIRTTSEKTEVQPHGFAGFVVVEKYDSKEDALAGHNKYCQRAYNKTLIVDTTGLVEIKNSFENGMKWLFDVAERARKDPEAFRATQGKTVYGVPVEAPTKNAEWSEEGLDHVISEDDIVNLRILLNITSNVGEFEEAI